MAINCFKNTKLKGLQKAYDSRVKEGMTDKELRDIGTEIALNHFNKLDKQMSNLKKSLGNKKIIPKPISYTPIALVKPKTESKNSLNETQAKGDTGIRKAPNGKKSNLTDNQWKKVRTKDFKDWFGDWENDPKNASLVIDSNGEPLVVFHGTSNIFIKFAQNINGLTYFSKNKYYAKDFAEKSKDSNNYLGDKSNSRIIEVFLNIRNPKEVKDLSDIDIKQGKIKIPNSSDGIIGVDAENFIQNKIRKNEQVYAVKNTNQIRVVNNETQAKGDTAANGDVQPGTRINNNQGQGQKIKPANDSKTSESSIEETLSLDDLKSDLEGIELEDDESVENTKPTTEKSSKKAKPLKTPRGKTPLDKRDIKDEEMLKAIKAEVYDAYSLVQKFFINGGRVLSTDISKLYKGSTKEILSRIGYARKDGKTIDDIAHALWEEFGTELNIDTQEFSNSVESVIQDFLSTKAMAVDLNTRNGEKLIETPEGLMTKEQFKDYENYLKDTEEKVANYLLTLTEEELLILEQEVKDYEEYEKRRINKKNSESGKKKSGVQTGTNRESGKSPEERQLDQKITEAQNSVSKAKTALQNKSKKLDESIVEDQDDLFGERASKTKNNLFDERVDLSQRENATSKERQALKDAQAELKRLKDAKENLKETTSQIDFKENKKEVSVILGGKEIKPNETLKLTPPKKLPNNKVEKIDDFGEKIGGARKDLVSELDGISEDDIANLPLSKSFPEPNYKKLIEDGIISEKAAMLLKFFYDAIPNKPRAKYKVKSWVLKIKENIKTFTDIINSETLSGKLVDNVKNSDSLGGKFNIFSKTMIGLGFPETNPKTGSYTIKQFINKEGSRFTIVKGNYIIKDFKTLSEAVAGLKLLLDSNSNKKATVKLNVYQDTKTKDYFIGKKTATGVFRIMEGFKSTKDAFIHLKDNKTEIENIWANLKLNPEERRNSNRIRVGTDWRNGKNITPEIFTNAFGFRGVEFGNWVENTRRQEALNETYDAFMDMANALGLSPRSISLNGTLGMAFGARGKGKAMAHYEPGKVVINLTKKKGAGSLGHEWFHALDNYFSRKFDRNTEFITDRPRTRIGKDGKLDERIRTEVLKAFKDLIDTINASGLKERSSVLDSTKSKAYWNTTIEMAARSFENFLITKLDSQNEQNDFLANFKETGDWLSQTGLNLDNYPYPLNSESDAINSSFQNLFDTLDVVPEKGKEVSKLDELENLLNTWENNIDQFGRENLSMGVPLVVAKIAIRAMKVSVKLAKTTAEVLQAGLDAIKNTDWYKSLTKDEQSEINDITVYQLIQNAKKSNAEQEVKPKVEKKVKEKTPQNTQPKTASNTEETSEKPQAFSTRSFNSEGLNQGVKDRLEKLGLDYSVKNQIVAENDGNKIIKEFGLLEAYKMAKNNQIRGGAKIFIQSKMFDELNQQIYNAQQKEDTDLSNELIDELSIIMKEFADEKTLMGQEISMLNRIYKTSDIKYDLEFAKIQWNKKFDKKMSPQIEARLKLQAQKIKNRDQKIKELEEKIGTLEEQDAFSDIKNAVNRHNKIASNKKYTLSTEEQKRKKQLKNKFFGTLNDVTRIATLLADPEFREYLGLVFKSAKGDLKSFAIKVRNEIGIKSKDISKKLFEEAEKEFNKAISKKLKGSNKEGKGIKIPSSLIYDLVESGVDNITDLTNEVHEVLKAQYSNLTQREVRDAITDYGKRVSETQDDIKLKISSLKLDGKQISALEDLAENKRPKRSGKKQAKKTAEQRNNLKKIQELLKTLKFDDVGDKENFYKTALEGYKTRIENRIKDLNEAINKGERIINERRNLPLDQEAKNLIEKRDKLQKEYDKTFGKPYKSDETLINEIVTRKEKQLSDLKTKLEYIKLNKSEQVKPTKREVSDPKINKLDELIESAREELREVLDEVGIAEQKRLARAKKYVQNSIKELERRINERDFAPRKLKKVKYDKELIELKRQQILDKTKYDIEFEKQEYKEMSLAEKSLDKIFKLFGTFKGLKATFDLSAMLRQGAFLGAGNPKEFAKATVDMHKFVVSNKRYKTWMATIESSSDYVYMMEDGLSITDTSGDVLRSEERFVGNLISNIPGIGKVTDASERAYGGFLNSLRISSYRKLVKQHEGLGYTRENNPEVFKRIAYYVNGATGRGKLGSDKNIAKVLNIVFFSPRMITGMFSVTKTLLKPTTKALRKESFKSLAAFVGYQYLSKLVIQQAYQLLVMPFTGEDEDDVSTDYRAVSTDFNKLRIGETRYDLSAGYGIAIRTLTRVLAQAKADGIEYGVMEFDGFTQGVGRESMKFLWNKTSPLYRQIVNFHTGEHPNDINKSIDDATAYDYFEALFVPLTLQELFKSIEDEVPVSKISFDTLLTVYGVGVQTYD